jgi:hypothetical protein
VNEQPTPDPDDPEAMRRLADYASASEDTVYVEPLDLV